MTVSLGRYPTLYLALSARFRGHDTRDLAEWSALATQDAHKVPLDAERAWLTRVKSSHRGIGRRKGLKHLVAGAVNQDYLDEICTITGLERLELGYPVTATSLDGLRALTRLRHLRIDSPRNITDFMPFVEIPSLRTLLVENAKHMADIEWLAGAHHLEVIGIEGSMCTIQKIASLAPLRGLKSLKAFFAVSTRLGDKDLSPLADCPNLAFLDCAKIAPRGEFQRLHRMKPDLVCDWFGSDMWKAIGQ